MRAAGEQPVDGHAQSGRAVQWRGERHPEGTHDTVIPRELLDRTWHYLLGESGAPTIARRDPVGHDIDRDALATLAGWLHERISFALRRPVPDAGPTTWTALAGRRPTGSAGTASRGDRAHPAVPAQRQRPRRDPGAPLRPPRGPRRDLDRTVRDLRAGGRGFFVGTPQGPGDAFLLPSAGEFVHLHPEGGDGSLHLALPPALAADAIRQGWAVAHPLAGVRLTPGLVLVYGPRDDEELEIVAGLVAIAHTWATGTT